MPARFRLILLSLSLLLAAPGGLVYAAQDGAKTALITGANRGIGLELARQLSAAGFRVIGTARAPGEAAELKALGVRVEQLDVADSASVRALADRLKGEPIDLLINNAGIKGHGAANFREIDFDQIALTFDVNSIGPMRVTQALLDNLARGKDRKVVQISSVMGSIERNQGGLYGYRASKAALNMLTRSLALELGREGYVCVVLHPGWVKTRMGGPGASITTEESVAGLVRVIGGLRAADNGRFLDYQGNAIPW